MPESGSNLRVVDIARLSSVSRSTVSRVINNHPNVKESTRQRVLEIIKQYEFKPNLAARALVSNRTRVIGILIPYSVSDIFTDPFFPILIQGITTAANRQNYSVTLWLSSSEVEKDEFYDQVLGNSLTDGIIITSAVVDYPLLEKLEDQGKPCVFIGRPIVEQEHVNFVDIETVQGAEMLVQHLIDRGRQRIGFIPGLQLLPATHDRQTGYLQTLEKAGIPFDPALIAPPGDFREQGGYESMQVLLEQKVDAVFAASDVMAMGAIRAIQAANLRVPEDIAVGGFDNIPLAAIHNPPLTTINQPISQLGAAGTTGLIQLLEHTAEAPIHEVLPVELVVREST